MTDIVNAVPKGPVPYWATALFTVISAALLLPTGRWLVENARQLHELRAITPGRLPAAGEPTLSAAPEPTLGAPEEGLRPVAFRLLAPAAQTVFLGGSFNGFNANHHPMEKTAEGLWETTVRLAPGRYEYKFKVDGRWELDPTNPERSPEPKASSLMEVR